MDLSIDITNQHLRKIYITLQQGIKNQQIIILYMSKSKTAQKKKTDQYPPEQILKQAKQFINLWTHDLKKDSAKWQLKHKQVLIPQTHKQIWLTYLGFIRQYMNDDRFNPASEYSLNLNSLKSPQNLKSFFLAHSFLNLNRDNKLGVTFTNHCFNRLTLLQEQAIQNVMLIIRVLSQGFISINRKDMLSLQEIGRSEYNQGRYFLYNLSEELSVIIFIGMEKVPFFVESGKQIQHFQLTLSLQFEKIIQNSYQYLKEIIFQLDQPKQQNVRFTFNTQDFPVDQGRKNPNAQYFNIKKKHSEEKLLKRLQVQPYKKHYVKEFESFDYFFKYESNKFFAVFNQNEELLHQQPRQKKQNYNQRQLSYSSAKQYVNYIGSIPNFKFKLTKQQKEAFGKDGNIIVIGRSGTGKTLLSILRLYSIEYLSKEQKIADQISIKKPKKKCVQYYLNNVFLQKNVFLTASPYLIEQILRQYDDMHNQVQLQHKDTCDECRESLNLQKNTDNHQDLDLLLEKIEKRQNIEDPISRVDKKLFPHFLTIKAIITMIDCGLKRPFFNIKETKSLKNKNKKAINIYSDNIYRLYQPLQNHLKIAFKNKIGLYTKEELKELNQRDAVLEAVEVTYQYFERNIWGEISQAHYKTKKENKHKVTPSVAWIQFFSIIKGSAKAHTTHLKCLSPKMYLQECKNHLLSEEQKMDVYYLFQEYEKWKIRNKVYDLMDVVNHILQEMMFNRYTDDLVDYIFIDQVQDLTPATIYLLTKMANKDIFYCGDTAQAISKGVSFKFSQIKTLFSKKYFKNCIQKKINGQQSNLTVNFRSHSKILMLANAIVCLIEQLFPKMIDTLQKQQSDLFGPSNLVINNGDQRYIYDVLLGPLQGLADPENQNQNQTMQRQEQKEKEPRIKEEAQEQQQPKEKVEDKQKEDKVKADMEKGEVQSMMNEESDEANSQIEELSEDFQEIDQKIIKQEQLIKRFLQSEQVILVRNVEQKNKLPRFLKKEHTLTCEQVKGLQYQDVIIYNFFASSPCKNKWSLLDYLDINDFFVEPEQFQSKLSRRAIQQGSSQSAQELCQEQRIELGFNLQKKKYNLHQIKRNQKYLQIDIKNYYEISNQLKQFYTLVTRAKHIVIIFDKHVPRQLTHFFNTLNIAKVFIPEEVNNIHQQLLEYRNRQSQDRYLNKKRLWNEQGMKMIARKNYDQALKSFEKAENLVGVKRVQAMKIQDQNQMQLNHIQNQLQNPQSLSKQEFKMKKIKLAKQRKVILQRLIEAADIFTDIQLPKKAAPIYVRAEQYKKAIGCYLQVENFQEAGQCYFKLQNYSQALENFEKCKEKNVGRVFDCYVKLEKWSSAFQLIKSNTQLLKSKLMQSKNIKSNIKVCLKQILDELLEKDLQFNNNMITFNKGFYEKDTRLKENQDKLKGQIANKSNKQSFQRLANINSIYNEFQLNFLTQQLTKLHREHKELTQSIQKISKQFVDTKQKQQQLQREYTNVQREYESIEWRLRKIQKKKFELLTSKQQQRKQLLKKLEIKRVNKKQLVSEIKTVAEELETIKTQKQRIQQKLDMLNKRCDLKSLEESIKYTEDFCKNNQYNISPINKKSRYGNNIGAFFQENVYVPFSQTRSRGQYYKQADKVYKVWMSKDFIQSLLRSIKVALDLAQNFVDSDVIKFQSMFDHRQRIANAEYQIYKQDYDLKYTLQIYKILKNLNCFSLCYIMCDFYSLKQHLCKTILNQICMKSKNFLQKRLTKDVVKENLGEQQSKLIINNEQILKNVGKQFLQGFYTKNATKQCLYKEYLLKDLVQGLILQGFYQNALEFLDESQSLRLCFLFMNYKKLLQVSMVAAERIGSKRLSKSKQYYFFDIVCKQQYSYLNLVNIFAIQKLFFDFDQCQRNPVLSKALQIEEIQLNDQQIQNCFVSAEYRKSYYQDQVSTKEGQVVIIQAQIKQKKQQFNREKASLHQFRKKRQKWLQKNRENLANLNAHIVQTNIEIQYINEDYIQQKAQLMIATQKKKKYDKAITSIQIKLSNPLASNIYQQQQVQLLSSKLRRLKAEFQKIKVDQTRSYQTLQLIEKELKEQMMKLQKLEKQKQKQVAQIGKNTRQIKSCNQSIDTNKKYFDEYSTSQNRKIQINKQFIRKWTNPTLANQREQEVNKEIIHEQKYKKVLSINEEKRKLILTNINKSSNLEEIKDEEYRFLQYYLKKQINTDGIYLNQELFHILKKILSSTNKIQSQAITDVQMCLVIIVYLRFLFSEQFRQACICVCQQMQEELKKQYYPIQNYNFQRNSLCTQYEYNKLKIEELQKKISNSDCNQLVFRKKRFEEDLNYFKRQNNQLVNKVNMLDIEFRSLGLDQLVSNPYIYISNLLDIFSKIKNVTQANFKFVQIFLGFFQCRVIKNSKTLGFLQGEYVFVEADSILLKKMKEQNLLKFGYYFDCHNKVVLANFSDAYKTVVSYFQKQHKMISQSISYLLKSKLATNQLNQTQKKPNMIDKILLKDRTIQDDGKLYKAQELTLAKQEDKKQLQKLYDQYRSNKILTKIRTLKRQVLQFYLNHEHKARETFHFALFQVKEYSNLQCLVQKMTIFNSKMLREIKWKLRELQQAKNNWINVEKTKHEEELEGKK